MGKKGDNVENKLMEIFRVFVIAIIIIYGGYSIVESLIKTVPLWIQVPLGGLLVAFVYAVKNQVFEFIQNTGK
jgi:mannose/fructose/N-acetylgalactosamine-specific phosphotransferase system component IIC